MMLVVLYLFFAVFAVVQLVFHFAAVKALMVGIADAGTIIWGVSEGVRTSFSAWTQRNLRSAFRYIPITGGRKQTRTSTPTQSN